MKNTGYRMKNIAAKSFDDLIMWKKAHQFILAVYGYTENFPRQEMYGLVSQLRRAAVSIPANIAEGFKKEKQAG
jgi:four helix bundle protein